MHRNIYFCIIFWLGTILPVCGQNSDKNKFTEAESFFLYEEYLDALPLYLELKKSYPDNFNLDYKIGRCYLYIPYQKERALKYLQSASKHIDASYKGKSLKETQAPPDAIYYLGRAYHIQNQLNEAIAAYEKFLGLLDENEYDPELVKHQIAACKLAEEALKNPIHAEFINLGKPLNDRFNQSNAVVSGNGKTLAYTSKLQFYDAVFVSSKTDDGWNSPRNIIPELKVDDKIYPTGLSYEGNELYLYKLDGYDGNIYVSKMENNQWTPPVKLNDNINTKYWESHGSVSKDGKTLYFTSNRPGGYGDLDIYFSRRANGNEWGKPVNAGSTINSNQNEDNPFLTTNGERLYFSSLGHATIGGYDIFYVEKQNGNQWGAPINMGYPVNTTDDNLFYQPTDNGSTAFYSLLRKDGFGLSDIYKLDLMPTDEPARIALRVQIKDGKDGPLQGIIINHQTGETILNTRMGTGEKVFSTTVTPGDYLVKVNGDNVIPKEVLVSVDENFADDVYLAEINLEAVKTKKRSKIATLFRRKKEPETVGNETVSTKEIIETSVQKPIPRDSSTNLKLIINDLININTNSDITLILEQLQNDLNSYATVDDIYNELVLQSEQNGYTEADVDLLMERYLLSLIRFYEEESVKNLLAGKIPDNEEKGTQGNIHTAFGELENIIYAIARLATSANISVSQISTFLETIGDHNLNEPDPETNSEAGIYNWLEGFFKNEQRFHSDTEIRATALSLLEIMLVSNHMKQVYQTGTESIKAFSDNLSIPEIRTILNYNNAMTSGIRHQKVSYNDVLNAYLAVNKNIDNQQQTIPYNESLATHQDSNVNNSFSIAMYGAGGILLILILIFLVRRRRKNPSK